MAGVTKEEIARAKELDLLTYFKLVEPSNLKLVGKEYRHKVHRSCALNRKCREISSCPSQTQTTMQLWRICVGAVSTPMY